MDKHNTILASDFAKTAYECFLEISKIPRGSGNEKAASEYLINFGKKLGLDAVSDREHNVLIRKPGSSGRENEQPVVLQAHIDIVCEKNQDSTHDFSKDPIIPVISGDWVIADGTTLGADNGGGLSMIMAVLTGGELSHPPIEALFTANEETGMTGASRFDASLLCGSRFINLDASGEGVITVSCAASTDVDIIIPVLKQDLPEGFASFKLMIKGLAGGHSGMDIHRGRANANILAGRLLSGLEPIVYYISSINGGAKRNAIPRECVIVVSFKEDDIETALSVVKRIEAEFKQEHPSDVDISITMERIEAVKTALAHESKYNALKGIMSVPTGVISMSPHIDGLVQTSCNLGVINTGDNEITLWLFPRSSLSSEQTQTVHELITLATSLGADIKIENEKPPWEYRENSPLRDKAANIFKKMYGKDATKAAVHAGLECGIFIEKIPYADIISIGPDIYGAHSPDEKMSLPAYYRTCEYLLQILKEI